MCVASQINSPATAAAISVTVARVSPYIEVPPPMETGTRSPERLFQRQPARVKAGRVELRGELLDRSPRVDLEHVFDDADLGVVVERHVEMVLRDEVDRGLGTTRTANGEPDRVALVPRRREQEERGRKDRSRLILRVAEEAPGPLPRADPQGGELRELRFERLQARGHQVQEGDAGAEPERRPVELLMRDETGVLLAAGAGEAHAEDGGMG